MNPGNLARAIVYVTQAILYEMEAVVTDEWFDGGDDTAKDVAVEKLSLDLADMITKLVEG